MRWWPAVVVPVCLSLAGMVPSPLAIEAGVLGCSLGQVIDAPGVDANAAVSEARAIVCSFMPSNDGATETYVGIARITIVSGKPPRQLHLDVGGKGASGNPNHAGPPATELRF